jgi:hypothetical protein
VTEKRKHLSIGGFVIGYPVALAVAIALPVFLLYLALDWIMTLFGGLGRLLLRIIS